MVVTDTFSSQVQPYNQGYGFAENLKNFRENIRPEQIREYWNYYEGVHWDIDETNEYKPTPTVNKIKTIIEKKITHTVGNTPTVVFLDDDIEELLGPYLEMLLEDSGGDAYFYFLSLLVGSVTGDVFIKPAIDQNNNVVLQVQESHLVNPYYQNLNSGSFIPDYVTIDGIDLDISFLGKKVTEKVIKLRELWKGNKRELYKDNKLVEKSESLLSRAPIVHIRNFHKGNEIFGISDVKCLIELNSLLNNAVRKFDDIIEYLAEPWFVGYGFKLEDVIAREDKTITGIPVDGKAELLQLDTDLPAVQKAIDRYEEWMHELGGITTNSIKGTQHISNTSGSALQYSFSPIGETVSRKQMFYKPGLERALSMGLELMSIHSKKYSDSKYKGIDKVIKEVTRINKKSQDPKIKNREWNYIELKFHKYVQKDQQQAINETILKVSNNLLSRKTGMKELGVRNIDLEEQYMQADTLRKDNQEGAKSYTNEVKSGLEKSSNPNDKEENEEMRKIEKIGDK